MTMRVRQFALIFILAVTSAVAFAAERPRDIVERQSNNVLTTLVQRRAEFESSPQKLYEFVRSELDQTFDREYSARLVLGRHGRGVPAAKVQAFADALTENLLRRYGKAMLQFDAEINVRVLSEQPLRDGKLIRVASELVRKGGSPVPVDYMLRPVGDEWKVFDVIVEGVSYVQTYRTQFEEQLRSQSLDQVIAALQAGTLDVGG
jgi:phospholipid transport system substrate-binding protein